MHAPPAEWASFDRTQLHRPTLAQGPERHRRRLTVLTNDNRPVRPGSDVHGVTCSRTSGCSN